MTYYNEEERIGFIDPDQGNKTSLAKSVQQSPVRYAIIQSNAPRLSSVANNTPFGAYNIDTGNKKTLESSVRDSRRFYSATFDSKTPRFRPRSTPESADVFYDPSRLKAFEPATVCHSIDATPQRYSILHSKYKRFPDRPPGSTDGPDVEYAVDCGNKMSLYTSIVKSPITYHSMGSATKKLGGPNDPSGKLGPGSYDWSYPADVRTSQTLHNKPLSSLSSSTPRFKGRAQDSSYGLGSTWTPERDQKSWQANARTVSKAEYVRPQYLPKAYEKDLKKAG